MATVETTAREAWLAERMNSIGASEAAAALGVHPHQSPLALFNVKCGFVEPDDLSGNEAVEFGIRLERPIIEAFSERSGRNVTPWPQFKITRHPSKPHISCTPDAVEYEDAGIQSEATSVVQIKTASAWLAREWKDEPPLHYQVQVMQEMAVLDLPRATLVVLIGGQRLKWFDVPRDDAFIEVMLQRLDEFWACVQSRTPPAIDWSESCSLALKKLHPLDSGAEVQLPEEAADWDAELRDAKAKIKELEQVEKLNENRLKAAIGDNTYGVLPDGSRYSWATRDRKGYTVQPTTYRQLTRVKSK